MRYNVLFLFILIFIMPSSLLGQVPLDSSKVSDSTINLIGFTDNDSITLETSTTILSFSLSDLYTAIVNTDTRCDGAVEKRMAVLNEIRKKQKKNKRINFNIDNKKVYSCGETYLLEKASVDLLNKGNVRVYNKSSKKYETAISSENVSNWEQAYEKFFIGNSTVLIYEVMFRSM